MASKQYQHGFTAIELMVTVAIAAILVAIAAPSFKNIIEKGRVEAGSNQLFTALMLTRNEAVSRNQSGVLCKSADGASCTTSGGWEQGYLIFIDVNSDGAQDAGETLIRSYEANEFSVTIRASGDFSSLVRYASDGSVTSNDIFQICGPTGASRAQSIAVNNVGRPRREQGANSCP